MAVNYIKIIQSGDCRQTHNKNISNNNNNKAIRKNTDVNKSVRGQNLRHDKSKHPKTSNYF